MTRPDLEAIRARCEAATPGPWRVTTSGAVVESISGVSEPQWADYGDGAGEWFTDRVTLVETDGGVYGPTMPDAQFIAHARTDIPSLLAYIEELTRERDAANARHEALSALVEGYRRERDNLRAEITKAQESFDDDGPSGWMPGETAIDALIRTRDEARAEADLLRGCGREHMWTWKTDGLTACAMCGVVQRADHANKPCRGVVRVGVRIEDEIASAYRRGAEAMREACIEETRSAFDAFVALMNIRALPIPEDKP